MFKCREDGEQQPNLFFQKDHSGCHVKDRMEMIQNRFTETSDLVI